MVTERSFGFQRVRVDDPCDRKISISIDGSCGRRGFRGRSRYDHRDTVSCQCTCEREFADIFGQRHNSCKRHGWTTTNGDGHRKRFVRFESLLMVDTHTAMELVVETDLFVGLVLVSGELDTVHTQVARGKFWKSVVGIDRWRA